MGEEVGDYALVWRVDPMTVMSLRVPRVAAGS